MILSILNLEKALLESHKPLLTSHCEPTLLRTSILLRLDLISPGRENKAQPITEDESFATESNKNCTDIVSPSDATFFKNAWNLACGIFSASLYRRPSYLVKSRVPLVVGVFRNLLDGLVRVADQNTFNLKLHGGQRHTSSQTQDNTDLTLEDLENMSHNLDRCLDLIRGVKLKEDFARVAPYMIVDIIEAGFTGQVTLVSAVKANLLSGMNKVCDIGYLAKHLATVLP